MKKYLLILICCLFVLGNVRGVYAKNFVDKDLEKALDNLLVMTDFEQNASFKLDQGQTVVDFILKHDRDFIPEKRLKATPAYITASIHTDLSSILKFAYSDLPTYLLAPASVRRGGWLSVQGKKQDLPKFWQFLPELTKPVVIKGVEQEENTPDQNTGTYHAYDMNRALVLFKDRQGQDVFISLTRQVGRSEVGKKGAVIGDDQDWNYLFSGEKGLTSRGLGWVSSYTYASLSATVYVQISKNLVHMGVFKWLRAGWAGMNMVKTHHIISGIERHLQAFKAILESPSRPSPEQLKQKIKELNRLSDEQLALRVKSYFQGLQQIDSKYLKRDPFEGQLASGTYIKDLGRFGMVRILALEYLKCRLGKKTLLGCSDDLADAGGNIKND